MNIFFLHEDPHTCAQWHCDKHVLKMIVEYAQLLSTAHHHYGAWREGMYKPTHANHPCAVWVRQSRKNYKWLLNLWVRLMDEYTYRWGKRHAATRLIEFLMFPPEGMPKAPEITVPPQVVTASCLFEPESLQATKFAYRKYYQTVKKPIVKYTKSERPFWMPA